MACAAVPLEGAAEKFMDQQLTDIQPTFPQEAVCMCFACSIGGHCPRHPMLMPS